MGDKETGNMNDTLILKDGSAIEMEPGGNLSDIKVISETKYNMLSTWDKLTEDNLSEVKIKNRDGIVVSNFKSLLLVSETSTIQGDGTILTSFHLREKTEVELLRERVEQLENGQEVQDEAISDLGTAVSDLAEGGLL